MKLETLKFLQNLNMAIDFGADLFNSAFGFGLKPNSTESSDLLVFAMGSQTQTQLGTKSLSANEMLKSDRENICMRERVKELFLE